MTDHVRKIVDSIKRLLKLRNEKNKPMSDHILITAQSLFDLTDEFERLEREKDAAQAELIQIKLKHGDEDGIVSAAYLFQKAEQEARAFMRRQFEAAAPKWISVEERIPERDLQPVLCVIKTSQGACVCEGYYSEIRNRVCPRDADFAMYKVTHWMPLPEPPEVEA